MIKIFFLYILIFSTAIARDVLTEGEREGHGGGLAEQNLQKAKLNLDDFIQVSLHSSLSQLNNNEREVLHTILDNWNEDKQSPLLFRSAQNNNIDFYIQGELKIAFTYDYIGAPIYINKDLLYPQGEPYSLSSSLALLVHEFGHHYKYEDHAFLDQIGLKVAKVLDSNTFKLPLNRQHRDLYLMTIDSNTEESFTSVMIQDREKLMDITEELKNQLDVCKSKGAALVGFYLDNFYWSKREIVKETAQTEAIYNASIVCKKESGENYISHLNNQKIQITFSL